MDLLIRLAEAWWPLYAVHFVEVSLFILLVWAVDRWMTLDTRLRYVLYLLALAKVFVPPFYAILLPEFLTFLYPAPSYSVPEHIYVDPVYSDVVYVVPEPPPPLAFYLFCLWGVSVVVWTGVMLWKNAAFHRALSLAVPVDLAREVGSLSGTRDMKVYAKASLRSPLLVGIVKPRLYLPSHWSSWSSEELRGVVAHELAHRDNRDIWVLIFQGIAMALFCVNPLVWLLNRRLTFLRELRCDEAVLRETNLTPAEYGRLLFGFVDRRPALSALYFNERGTALKKRLEYVLNFKDDSVKRSRWQLAIPILIGLAIVPFSIREAYTQDEGDLEVMELAEYERKLESASGQQSTLSASGNADSREFMGLTEVEEKIEKKPEVSRKAVLINDARPGFIVYPEKAIRDQIEGTVSLRFLINVDGSVSDVRIFKGPEIFHQTAIEAVSQWRFKPAKHDGKAMPAWMAQQFKFERSEWASMLFYRVSFIPPIATGNGEELIGSAQSGSQSSGFLLELERQAAAAKTKWAELAKFIEAKQKFKPKQQNASSASADAGRSKVLEFFMVEAKPKLRHSVEPVYPEGAKEEGKVLLKFVVNVDGSVSDVTVLRAIGPEVFRQAAIDAISQFQFKPAEHNGKPVAVWMTQLIKF